MQVMRENFFEKKVSPIPLFKKLLLFYFHKNFQAFYQCHNRSYYNEYRHYTGFQDKSYLCFFGIEACIYINIMFFYSDVLVEYRQ